MAYDGSVNSDGWSNVLNFNRDGGTPGNANSYTEFPSTWYTKGYMDTYLWARSYVNRTELRQRLKSVTVMCCAGYSGDRSGAPAQFTSLSGPGGSAGLTGPVYGYGCTWQINVYIVGGGSYSSNPLIMPAISRPNSSAYGYCPNVAQELTVAAARQTDFGNASYPNNTGNLAIHANKLEFNNNALWLEPNQRMYIHLQPISWRNTSGNTVNPPGTQALIKFTHNGAGFEAEFEDEPSNFIWRFNASKQQWERVLPVWQCQNENGQKVWTKLTGE